MKSNPIATLLICLFLIAVGMHAQGTFYSFPGADLSRANNGDILHTERIEGAPEGATAYRMLYRSEGKEGEPIAVSGVIIIPLAAAPPEGRPVVAWAHPTTGIEPKCAPSKARVLFDSIPGLRQMLRQRFVVAATDYPGLGTPGPHPFLVGASEARAVLDLVRAAQKVPEAKAGRKFAVWGHSQGGQAALFAGSLARTYAPELELIGIAAAAPATDLIALLEADQNTGGGKNLTAMTLWSWSRVYGAPLPDSITQEGRAAMDRLANGCIETIFDFLMRRGPTRDIARNFSLPPGFATTDPWRALLAQNTPGPIPSSIPLFLSQGNKDGFVLPGITERYRAKQCATGGAVQFLQIPNAGHAFVARESAADAVQWIADRFSNKPAPSNCERR